MKFSELLDIGDVDRSRSGVTRLVIPLNSSTARGRFPFLNHQRECPGCGWEFPMNALLGHLVDVHSYTPTKVRELVKTWEGVGA